MSNEYEKCKKWLEEAFEKKIKEIGIEKWRFAMMLDPHILLKKRERDMNEKI